MHPGLVNTTRLFVVAILFPLISCQSPQQTKGSSGLFPIEQNGQAGYVNAEGAMIIPLQFQKAAEFAGDQAAVKLGGKWGYINADGKIVINPQFDRAGDFSEGLAAVRIGAKYGYVDQD